MEAAGFGGWDEHVNSWHAKDMPFPRLTLRYEDLKTNPVEGISRLCRFLKITRSEKDIDDAIAAPPSAMYAPSKSARLRSERLGSSR